MRWAAAEAHEFRRGGGVRWLRAHWLMQGLPHVGLEGQQFFKGESGAGCRGQCRWRFAPLQRGDGAAAAAGVVQGGVRIPSRWRPTWRPPKFLFDGASPLLLSRQPRLNKGSPEVSMYERELVGGQVGIDARHRASGCPRRGATPRLCAKAVGHRVS
jgi:hypothetical protein